MGTEKGAWDVRGSPVDVALAVSLLFPTQSFFALLEGTQGGLP